MATDVRVTGLWSLSPVTLGFFGTGDDGGAFEAWGEFTQLQWSAEYLYEDGGQLVSTGF